MRVEFTLKPPAHAGSRHGKESFAGTAMGKIQALKGVVRLARRHGACGSGAWPPVNRYFLLMSKKAESYSSAIRAKTVLAEAEIRGGGSGDRVKRFPQLRKPKKETLTVFHHQ